jgi:hypothetical protein
VYYINCNKKSRSWFQNFPLLGIAKEETEAFIKKLGLHSNIEFFSLYSQLEYSNNRIIALYLQIMWEYYDLTFDKTPRYEKFILSIELIWDYYLSDRNYTVPSVVKQFNIYLRFIPEGGLKTWAGMEWTQQYNQNSQRPENKKLSIDILLSCWKDLKYDSFELDWSIFPTHEHQDNSRNDYDDEVEIDLNELSDTISHTHFTRTSDVTDFISTREESIITQSSDSDDEDEIDFKTDSKRETAFKATPWPTETA